MAETSWLTYANQDATRSLPLSDDLQRALGYLPELGVTMEVFSGGQPAAGEGPRIGSTRHDHGNAADVFFYKDGERLDWSNPAHVPIFQQIVQKGKQNGITGWGAGDGYMKPGSMHLGFGTPAVWGAGGKGTAAPEWLRAAYAGKPINPAVGAINSAAPAKKPAGIMGGIGAGIGNLLGYAGQQAAPIMQSAQNAGQNSLPSIMKAALGSVAARTALIDPAIKNIMTGNRSGALGTSPPATGYGSKGYSTIMAPGGGAKFNNAQGVWMGGLSGPGSVPQAHGGSEIDKHRGEIQKTNGRSFY